MSLGMGRESEFGRSLETAAETIVSQFDEFGAGLGAVIASSSALMENLNALQAEADAPTPGERALGGALSLEQALAELLQCTAAALADLEAKQFRENLDAAQAILGEVARASAEMRIISTLTAISTDEDGVADYVASLQKLGGDFQQTSGVIAHIFEVTHKTQDESVEAFAQARGAIEAADADAPKTAVGGPAGSLEQEASGATRRLTQEISERLPHLIRQLQFSDRFRQRAEHLAEAIALAEQRRSDPGAAAALIRVGRAQLADIRAELAEATDEVGGHVAAIAGAAEEAVRRLAGGLERNDRLERMKAEAERSSTLLASVQTVDAAMDRLSDRSSKTLAAFEEARTRLEGLNDVSRDLDISSINVAVLARRLSRGREVLGVLADAARQAAVDCRARVEQLFIVFDRMSAAQSRLRLDEARAATERLRSAAKEAHVAAQEAQRRIAETGARLEEIMRKTSDLGAATLAATRALSLMRRASDTLAEIEARFPEAASPDAPIDPAAPALHALAESYTMERERRVHAAALGLALPAEDAPAEEAEQELDDILF